MCSRLNFNLDTPNSRRLFELIEEDPFFSRFILVRTYVNHVKNICHLELANPLTKHTLLVIW